MRGSSASLLAMAALVAVQLDPVLKTFHPYLLRVGKPRKLALTFRIRKPLHTPNTILKTHTPWTPRKDVKQTFSLPFQRPVEANAKGNAHLTSEAVALLFSARRCQSNATRSPESRAPKYILTNIRFSESPSQHQLRSDPRWSDCTIFKLSSDPR
jgi:hypothetical protein